MIVAHSIEQAREAIRALPRPLGFVPTMGALHPGHLSLVRIAASRCASVVASVFVNPTQFLPGEDLESYPRDESGDITKLTENGATLVFAPTIDDLYPEGFFAGVYMGGPITETFEASCRPGHFDGVALVVTKLLNIVQPDVAVFGQKDAQQLAMLRQLIIDLNLPVEILGAPIVREPDGLAMSSRNAYLSPEQRAAAPALIRALRAGREAASVPGATCNDAIVAAEVSLFESNTRAANDSCRFAVDYLTIVDGFTFCEQDCLDRFSLMIVAARLGSTRLIDNIWLINTAHENEIIDELL